ncbi:transcriptional regulator [Burkholderia ubonensis]|uniref:WYL domain-containing protein n=1 Tax=Burkholderia ubonensis TaxID=101571 RepID=UPI00075D0750|nr:WYL domain-containing protein [Burkholderia ubonensis]KVU98375.1 transcriptional regulator [Burkholderia ubonensis]
MTDTTQDTFPPKTNTRWGQERRLAFIDFRLRWEGRINRADLTDFFGISVPQASLDISRYTELAPENLVYDRSSRVYQATAQFHPVHTATQPHRYLNELLASATGVLEREDSFIGWQPPIDSVPHPGRNVACDMLSALLKAIRDASGLRIVYQSMSRLEPSIRAISPHAFAHDGFRWHVRAFCHSRAKFLDFVLGRILEVQEIEPVGRAASEDTEWNTILQLVIAPNPELSPGKRRAIELDYGMNEGQMELKCRQALLFYTLRRLGLNQQETQRPEAQHIVLKNEADLIPFLSSATADR